MMWTELVNLPSKVWRKQNMTVSEECYHGAGVTLCTPRKHKRRAHLSDQGDVFSASGRTSLPRCAGVWEEQLEASPFLWLQVQARLNLLSIAHPAIASSLLLLKLLNFMRQNNRKMWKNCLVFPLNSVRITQSGPLLRLWAILPETSNWFWVLLPINCDGKLWWVSVACTCKRNIISH